MPTNRERNRDWVVYVATSHSYTCVYMVSRPMHYNDANVALEQFGKSVPCGMRRATEEELQEEAHTYSGKSALPTAKL